MAIKHGTKSGWWKKAKHQSVRWLVAVFHLEDYEFMKDAQHTRAHTAKGKSHATRQPGSKILKRHDRFEWNRRYRADS